MKRLILLLIVLLGAQSYGVYGATQARKLTVDCDLEVGILCFDWRPNALGELLGEGRTEDVEARLEAAERAWEREVVDRLRSADEGGLEGVLQRLGEIGGGALERARKAADQLGGDD